MVLHSESRKTHRGQSSEAPRSQVDLLSGHGDCSVGPRVAGQSVENMQDMEDMCCYRCFLMCFEGLQVFETNESAFFWWPAWSHVDQEFVKAPKAYPQALANRAMLSLIVNIQNTLTWGDIHSQLDSLGVSWLWLDKLFGPFSFWQLPCNSKAWHLSKACALVEHYHAEAFVAAWQTFSGALFSTCNAHVREKTWECKVPGTSLAHATCRDLWNDHDNSCHLSNILLLSRGIFTRIIYSWEIIFQDTLNISQNTSIYSSTSESRSQTKHKRNVANLNYLRSYFVYSLDPFHDFGTLWAAHKSKTIKTIFKYII